MMWLQVNFCLPNYALLGACCPNFLWVDPIWAVSMLCFQAGSWEPQALWSGFMWGADCCVVGNLMIGVRVQIRECFSKETFNLKLLILRYLKVTWLFSWILIYEGPQKLCSDLIGLSRNIYMWILLSGCVMQLLFSSRKEQEVMNVASYSSSRKLSAIVPP